MLRTSRYNQAAKRQAGNRPAGTAPLRRPGAIPLQRDVGSTGANPGRLSRRMESSGSLRQASTVRGKRFPARHPLCRADDNNRLHSYEQGIKQAFNNIVPTLKNISAIQHDADFKVSAQRIAREGMGFELPDDILEDAWVEQLDMKRLFAWCVFYTYKHFCNEFFTSDAHVIPALDSNEFLQSCGFHTLDISPCADGRLAHIVLYILRLDPQMVRRKSYAGAMFDVEDSMQKWVEIELQRFREGRPNRADEPTRYLKVVAYHYSSSDPEHEGCAAHGSDTTKAARAGLERLTAFRQAIENSFCCGASIDLLLVGVDTDTDAIRIHIPDDAGNIDLDRFVESATIYAETLRLDKAAALREIEETIKRSSETVSAGMMKFIARLIENNLSQIEYVSNVYGERYPDIGHAEYFIGAGIGYEDIQLRNLMYFAYLQTVEEGETDLDVGVKIFRKLNVLHGLPVPIVVRFDYHGTVPGARDRAEQRCKRVAKALTERYKDLFGRGLLHILQVVRDCDGNGVLEIVACTVNVNHLAIEAGRRS